MKMWSFILLALLGTQTQALHAQKLSAEDVVVRNWIIAGKPAAAAAFLDASVLVAEPRDAEERIRLLLLSAVAHAESGDFTSAYQRTRQAEELLEWTSFQDRLTYDDKARNRIRASVELVLHDIRQAESRDEAEAAP